ncbi:hypothetical protein [Frigoriglobus tundricola]|uniref:Uncharacterized protein n=1 Tax=Frigoriglobus tundricola TaxID=2774151 RepID=A0A6M5Z6M4_9BACT|nr:hypothetical protein [Frigoriglobus tundricola]QJX01252.1 hypothetical protein FTUN_8891 [Frigoriglobus tundricola]
MATEVLTTGVAAVTIGHGVQRHHLDRLARRGLIPYQSAGGGSKLRLIRVSDLDAIRAECERRGYYRASEPVA